MNCECSLKKLVAGVLHAEKVVGKKESLPVLSCVLLEVQKDLIIRATNLETAVRISIPARVEKKGVAAVPSQVFLQALQSTRGEKVTIEFGDEGNIIIQSSGGTTTIKTISHDEFPTFPIPPKKDWNTFNVDVFLKGVQSVVYAASQSMIRPELASIFLSNEDGEVIFAATDSFRLAEKKIKHNHADVVTDVLLPAKNIMEVHHILSNNEENEVDILVDDSQIYFKTSSIEIISRVIDGSFPDYKQIIPSTFETEATVLKEDLVRAFKKARVFSNQTQQINFHIYPKKKIFTITAQNFDIGETSESIDAAVSGNDIDINFNLHYVSECLQSIHTDSVVLQFAGAHKPVVIKGVSDSSFSYLAMPLSR